MAAQHIAAPFSTPEKAADVLGVPKSRMNRLLRWANKSRDGSLKQAKVKGPDGKVTTRKAASK